MRDIDSLSSKHCEDESISLKIGDVGSILEKVDVSAQTCAPSGRLNSRPPLLHFLPSRFETRRPTSQTVERLPVKSTSVVGVAQRIYSDISPIPSSFCRVKKVRNLASFLLRFMECRRSIMRKLSVRLYVKRMDFEKTKESSAPILYHMKERLS